MNIQKLWFVFLFCALVCVPYYVSAVEESVPAVEELVPAHTQEIFQQNDALARSAGLDQINSDPRFLVTLVVQVISSVLGVVLMLYAVYGGYIILMSNGDSEQVGAGKKIIAQSIIGAAIFVSAYSISRFIGTQLQKSISPVPLRPVDTIYDGVITVPEW